MPLCYEQNFEVFHFECDAWDNMKPAAVLRRAQEIATDQCESLGLTEELYRRTNTVFLLSRLSLLVWRMPRVDEKVRIETRAYGMRRAVYHRITSFYSAQGEKLCETDGRWVLVDTVNRRILRKPLDEFLSYFNEDPKEEHSFEVPKVGDYNNYIKHVAAYSMCDRNGHINNTRYADIACDALPIEKLTNGGVHRMVFNYRSEIALGEEFEFACAQLCKNSFMCTAMQNSTRKFECYIE